MRTLARWFVVVAFFGTVAFAGAAPLLDRDAPSTSSASASTDGTSSGFTSRPAPEKTAYIGPSVAISGSTLSGALVPSPSLVVWRLPSRATAASSPALHVSRLSPHLRSIPLLI